MAKYSRFDPRNKKRNRRRDSSLGRATKTDRRVKEFRKVILPHMAEKDLAEIKQLQR